MMNVPTEKLMPQEVLRNNKVWWHVCGGFAKENVIKQFVLLLTSHFDVASPIKSVYGAPDYLWNSSIGSTTYTKDNFESTVRIFEDLHIPLIADFSNPRLTENDLTDIQSNYMLERISDRRKNGVIVSSDILSEHIRNKFPNLKQISSRFYVSNVQVRDRAFYQDLSSRFDKVIINPNDNFNLALLSSLDNKNKFEIIVNSRCIIGCPNFTRCSLPTYDFFETDEQNNFIATQCPISAYQSNFGKIRNNNLTYSEISALVDLGFTHFQIADEAISGVNYIYDIARYILEPTFVGDLVLDYLFDYFK